LSGPDVRGGHDTLERLRRGDLKALQRSVADLYALRDLATFRSQIVQALAAIVRSDVAVYAEVDPRSRRVRWSPEVTPTLGLADPEATFARHMGDLPIFSTYRRGQGSATKISDFMTQREFRRTAIYNEFYRRVTLDQHIAKGLPGPPGLVTSVCMLRQGRDFSERDRLLLDLLRPHLNQAYRNAHAFDAMQRQSTSLREGLDALDHGLVGLDREYRVVYMTGRARQWIADYFEAAPGDALAPSLARWVRRACRVAHEGDAPAVREPLTVAREDRELVVRLVSTGAQHLLMLTQRHTRPRPDALQALGLSRRETEVLTWVAEGKTNPEIATILGANVRTIEKHLENVLTKLGVETRTAAAALALSVARS
jgi:DNA-binding CsgD family transcriptional regulator